MDKHQTATLQDLASSGLIKSPQLILLLLAHKRGAGWETAELAKATGLSMPRISMAKRRLTADGMITEHYPERDHRVSKMYPTDKGRQEGERCWKLLRAFIGLEPAIRGLRP